MCHRSGNHFRPLLIRRNRYRCALVNAAAISFTFDEDDFVRVGNAFLLGQHSSQCINGQAIDVCRRCAQARGRRSPGRDSNRQLGTGRLERRSRQAGAVYQVANRVVRPCIAHLGRGSNQQGADDHRVIVNNGICEFPCVVGTPSQSRSPPARPLPQDRSHNKRKGGRSIPGPSSIGTSDLKRQGWADRSRLARAGSSRRVPTSHLSLG